MFISVCWFANQLWAIEQLRVEPQNSISPGTKITLTFDVAQAGNTAMLYVEEPQTFVIQPNKIVDNGAHDENLKERQVTTSIMTPVNLAPGEYTLQVLDQNQSMCKATLTVATNRAVFLAQAKDFIPMTGNEQFIEYILEGKQTKRSTTERAEPSANNVWVCDLVRESRQLTALTTEGYCSSPVWSPDGDQIAYVLTQQSTNMIKIISLDMNRRVMGSKIIIEPPEQTFVEISNLLWSPDGKKIAFVARHQGEEKQIWVVRLADHTCTQTTQNLPVYKLLKWSSDSSAIAFLTRDNVETSFPALGEKLILDILKMGTLPEYEPPQAVLAVNTITGKRQELTYNAAWKLLPHLSPDNAKLVFQRLSRLTGQSNIWIMDSNGKNPVPLTYDDYVDQDPVWSPDGREIVFISNRVLGEM